MPDYAGVYGGVGAVEGLRDVVAQKILKEKLAESFRQARAQEAEQAAQRAQQAENARALIAERIADRAYQKDRDYTADLRDTRREDARLRESQIEREIGAKDKIDLRNIRAAERKEDLARFEANREDTQAFQRELQGQALANAREIAGMRQTGDDRPILVEKLDPETGKTIRRYMRPSEVLTMGEFEAPGKQTGGAKTQIADLSEAERLATSIQTLGNQIGWRGIGPIAGPTTGAANKYFSGRRGGDRQVSRLHAQIANLYSLISHERFGAALTAGEQTRAAGFLPSRNDSVLDLQEKLDDMLSFARSKRASLTGVGTRGGRTTLEAAPGEDEDYDLVWTGQGFAPKAAPPAPAVAPPPPAATPPSAPNELFKLGRSGR